MSRNLVVQHDFMAPAHSVGASDPPLGAFPLFVCLEVSCGELYAAGRAAGGAARALGAFVALHPVPAVAVRATVVTALYSARAYHTVDQS